MSADDGLRRPFAVRLTRLCRPHRSGNSAGSAAHPSFVSTRCGNGAASHNRALICYPPMAHAISAPASRYDKRRALPTGYDSMADLYGIVAILVLVAANGFFVTSEFSLVAVQRSRIAQLAAVGRTNAAALPGRR